jgi:hypothetical protein
MSSKPSDDEDLTRVLDGWVPGRRGEDLPDPTKVLDGWRPDAGPDGRRPERALPRVDELQPRRHDARPDPAATRLPRDLDLNVPTRYSKWDASDVTDVDAVWKPAEQAARAAGEAAAEGGWQPGAISTSVRRAAHPRVLPAWKPGAWIGAMKSVFDSVARVVSTPQGPVVDTYPPHVLLALWEPQNMTAPFLGRWPLRAWLSPVQPEEAGAELLQFLPPEAELWLGEHDIDWGLVGEAVLLHEPGLRDFQLKELRAFVDAERLATWERVNKAYRLPASGQPIERL